MADKWTEWESRRPPMPKGVKLGIESRELAEYMANWVSWFDSCPTDRTKHDPWEMWGELLSVAPQICKMAEFGIGYDSPPPMWKEVYFVSMLGNFVMPDRREVLRAVIWQLIENDIVDLLALHARSKAK